MKTKKIESSELENGFRILSQRDDRAVFCNCKWSEAKGLAGDAWKCYMELGKELRELKDGELKGKFQAWCKEELEFSYDWANILIKAYSRYELSEFTDPPQNNLQLYAEPSPHVELTPRDIMQTEQNSMKTKTVTPIIVKDKSPFEVFCENENLDDLQSDIAKDLFMLSRRMVKRYGRQAIEETKEFIKERYDQISKLAL